MSLMMTKLYLHPSQLPALLRKETPLATERVQGELWQYLMD